MSYATSILKYQNDLTSAGVSDIQAEIHAKTLAELIDQNLATKQDLKDLENRMIIKFSGMIILENLFLFAALEYFQKV